DTGIYNGTRMQVTILLGQHWVKWAAPTALNNIDIFDGIRTCCNRPQHLINVRWIDIIVNNNAVPHHVGERRCHSCHSCLSGMTRISLFYRNYRYKPTLIAPISSNLWYAYCLKIVPDSYSPNK